MKLKFIKPLTITICSAFIFAACSTDEIKKGHILHNYSIVDTTDNEHFIMEIMMETPSEDNSKHYKMITEDIISEFMGDKFKDMNINKAMRAYTDTAHAYFKLSNKEYRFMQEEMMEKEDIQPVLKYEEKLWIVPRYVTADSIASYARKLYIYQGGAHGLETSKYAVYDQKTGERIKLEQLYSKDEKMQLKYFLHESANALRAAGKLPESDDIFNNSLIEAHDNFYITDSSLVFHYNPYDIAPYSYGSIELEVKK